MNTFDRRKEKSTFIKWLLFLSFCGLILVLSWWLIFSKSELGHSSKVNLNNKPLLSGDQISKEDFSNEISVGLLGSAQNRVWNSKEQKSVALNSDLGSLKVTDPLNIQEAVNRAPLLIFHFWASWCGPCLKEIPEMMNWADHQPTALILAISIDTTEAAFVDFMKTLGNLRSNKSWPTNMIWIWDSNKSSARYFGVERLPETYFLDPDRKVKIHKVGSFNWDPKSL